MSTEPPDARGAGRPRVLLLCDLDAHARRALGGHADLLEAATVSELPSPLLAGVEAVVLRSGSVLAAADLARLPSLRLVVRPGSGTDNIDTAALRARRVPLLRNAEIGAAGVAEICRASLVLLARRVPLAHNAAAGGVHVPKSELVGDDTAALDAVVWGAGPVGRACAAELGHAVRRVAFARHRSLRPSDPSVEPDVALAEADVHVLAVPLRADTRPLVSAAWLRRAAARRPYLLNVARTQVVDVDALADALAAGRLRGVLLEPVDRGDLERCGRLGSGGPRNVLVSQHAGGQRADLRRRLDAWAADVLLGALGAAGVAAGAAGSGRS